MTKPHPALTKLLAFLGRVPAIQQPIGSGVEGDGNWRANFSIDITHPLAWNVVQELAYVLNNVSIEERLPTVFMPFSPPPYLNGGPDEYLSWVIESRDPSFTPDLCAEWLEGHMPNPVDDEEEWSSADEGEEEDAEE